MDELNLSDQLDQVLYPDPKERLNEQIEKYLAKDMWEIDDFAALMVGMHPSQFREFTDNNTHPTDPEDYRKMQTGIKIALRASKYFGEQSYKHCILVKGIALVSPWRLVKWLADESIPVKHVFFRRLPFHLMDLYGYFLTQSKVKPSPRYIDDYNREFYQRSARAIIAENPDISRKELCQRLIPVATKFVPRPDGGRYSQKTLRTDWLKKVHKQPRGRPSKQARTHPKK